MNRKYEAVIGLVFTFYYLLFLHSYTQKSRLSKLFLLNYELNIGLASLFSVIFYTFALLIGGSVQRIIASQTREGIFALSVSYSKVWKTLNIESDGYRKMCHPWCIIFMTQPQLCLNISYTGWGYFVHSFSKVFSRHLSRRMQRYDAPSFSCIYR